MKPQRILNLIKDAGYVPSPVRPYVEQPDRSCKRGDPMIGIIVGDRSNVEILSDLMRQCSTVDEAADLYHNMRHTMLSGVMWPLALYWAYCPWPSDEPISNTELDRATGAVTTRTA